MVGQRCICNEGFMLQSHQRRHTEGKTPHPCPMCPKHYAKNRSLLQHMAKVHAVSSPDNVVIDVTANTEDGDNDS